VVDIAVDVVAEKEKTEKKAFIWFTFADLQKFVLS
jgi:hypothetical protein